MARRKPKTDVPTTDAPQLPAERKPRDLPAIPLPRAVADMRQVIADGAAVLREAMPAVLSLAVEYARDRTSPHHDWAMKLLLERGLPVRTWAAAGINQVNGGNAGGDMPRVFITITKAEGPHKIPADITVQPIEPLVDEAEWDET